MQTDILTTENAILGACLENPGLWQEVFPALHTDDLLAETSRAIWNAACSLDSEGAIPDAVSIADRVAQSSIDRKYLIELMQVACMPSAVEQNVELVRRESRRRALEDIGRDITLRAQQGDDPNTIASDAEKALSELDERDSGDLLDGTQLGLRFWERIDRGTGFVPTGIPSLDKLLGGGLLDSALYILAARPGCGKTALGLQIADYAAAHSGGVLFVTLEQDDEQIQARRLARVTGIPALRLLHGEFGDKAEAVALANKRLCSLPLQVNKRLSCTVSDVRALARKVKDLRLVAIDYLGLLRPEHRYKTRYEQVSDISGELKTLARALKVPVLCLAQLNRASEQRRDNTPMLSDLRDSGSIEQDADAVLLLHRDDLTWEERPDAGKPVEVNCNLAKHRHGSIGKFPLAFDLPSGKFYEFGKRGA